MIKESRVLASLACVVTKPTSPQKEAQGLKGFGIRLSPEFKRHLLVAPFFGVMFNGECLLSNPNSREDVDLVFALLTRLRQRVSLALAMTVRNLSLKEHCAGKDKSGGVVLQTLRVYVAASLFWEWVVSVHGMGGGGGG